MFLPLPHAHAQATLPGAMGYSEQFAQRTLAEDAERLDGGLARWRGPLEIHLEKVTTDGSLVPLDRERCAHLAAPWSELTRYRNGEVMIELKLAGNHLDLKEVERALLRRQALRVQRLEEAGPTSRGNVALWLVAPHLPAWLTDAYTCDGFAPGCYWIEPPGHNFLWIAANELPLRDELIAFLLARSGQSRDEFARWVVHRRPLEWLSDMLEYIPVSPPTYDELLQRFGPKDDPEVEARRQDILQALLQSSPQARQQLIEQGQKQGIEQGQKQGIEQGQLISSRAHLRRVLERRQLRPSPAEVARIEACTELATLERWLDGAITAASVAEVLADPPA